MSGSGRRRPGGGRLIQTAATVRPRIGRIGGADSHNGAEDGSDLTQATLLRVAKSIADYRGSCDPEFKAWIRQILRRQAIDMIGRKLPAVSLGPPGADSLLCAYLVADGSTPSEGSSGESGMSGSWRRLNNYRRTNSVRSACVTLTGFRSRKLRVAWGTALKRRHPR